MTGGQSDPAEHLAVVAQPQRVNVLQGLCIITTDDPNVLEKVPFHRFLVFPQIPGRKHAVSKMKCGVKRLLPAGIPFITLLVGGSYKELPCTCLTTCLSFSLPVSPRLVCLSDPGVSVCPRHSIGRRGLRSDALLCRGYVHHVRLRRPPQRSPRRRLEMGRLQRGRGVRRAGVQGVRRRQREPSRCSLGDEPTQQ